MWGYIEIRGMISLCIVETSQWYNRSPWCPYYVEIYAYFGRTFRTKINAALNLSAWHLKCEMCLCNLLFSILLLMWRNEYSSTTGSIPWLLKHSPLVLPQHCRAKCTTIKILPLAWSEHVCTPLHGQGHYTNVYLLSGWANFWLHILPVCHILTGHFLSLLASFR